MAAVRTLEVLFFSGGAAWPDASSYQPAPCWHGLGPAILAAILGGIDPYGGFGRVTGLVVALFILQTISSGFNLLGFSQHLTLALWGFTLIAVMATKRIAGVFVTRFRSRSSSGAS
jgi:ribose/xylose/arabinose/galactoside ABC-type transport system permease subunit